MKLSAEQFEGNLRSVGVLEKDQHHEFASGVHGFKLDFSPDVVAPGSQLYREWVYKNFLAINRASGLKLPGAVIGVDSGTNNLALDVACELGTDVYGLQTKKDPNDKKIVRLTNLARQIIQVKKPELVVVVEDVGTTGYSAGQVAEQALDAGAQEAEVQLTWQRRYTMVYLDEVGIAYRAIINAVLPDLTPEECMRSGPCSEGVELIAHGQ